jgi:hypothetical protein
VSFLGSVGRRAPDDRRDQLRELTRMGLIRTLAAWRPDMTDDRDVASA